MAEALKHFFDSALIRSLAADITRAHPSLDSKRFVADGLHGLEALSLTARGSHLAEVLRRHLPAEYERAVEVLLASLGAEHDSSESFGMAPFRYLPHVTFVARFGLDHFETSMRAQYELTKRFTAEGSIRPFIVKYPEQTLERLVSWSSDPSVHVRRLVSEGTRPRLPWASRLPAFQKDPRPVLALLERLKDDPERYVQRSVANNLNDIAKDHPALAVEVCRRWSVGAGAGRRWIVKHALRSLIKQGDRGALELMGVGAKPRVAVQGVTVSPARPVLGAGVVIEFELSSTAAKAQDLLVDFAVHFVKANGSSRAKVFKLQRVHLPGKSKISLRARVSLADLTTRKHYPGRHSIDLLVNGVRFDLCEFELRNPRARP
jgi:3-methyladenine DNA glycosylase AlkC